MVEEPRLQCGRCLSVHAGNADRPRNGQPVDQRHGSVQAGTSGQLGYLLRRGYDLFISGQIDRTEFGKRLAQEWTSFPVLSAVKGASRDLRRGQSYYAGDGLNKVLVSPEKVESVLDQVKIAGRLAVVKPKPAPEPVVVDAGELETPASKSKTVWTWLLTTIGAPIATFGNLDWRVQLAIVAVIVGFAIYGIKRRADLAEAVHDLKADFG